MEKSQETHIHPRCNCQQVARARVVSNSSSPNVGRVFWRCSSGSCQFFCWKEDAEAREPNVASTSHSITKNAIRSVPKSLQSIESSTIDDWRLSSHLRELNDSVTISRLTQENVVVFKKFLSRLKQRTDISQLVKQSFEKAYSSLALWDAGYGVRAGELNERLAASVVLRKSVLESLISISKTLITVVMSKGNDDGKPINHDNLASITAEAEEIYSKEHDALESSDSQSDCSSVNPSDNWDEIAEDLLTDVQCLMDLDPLIQSPVINLDRRYADHDNEVAQKIPHRLYTDKINNRFPQADANLVDRLGRANLERFLINQAMRDQNSVEYELSVGKSLPSEGPKVGVVPAINGPRLESRESTQASNIQSERAYAETFMSYKFRGRVTARIPPLSSEAKQGGLFDCLACGQTLSIRDNSDWKKHLYRDLRPWICHDMNCKYGNFLFGSHDDWAEHLAADHKMAPEWSSFQCPFCREQTGEGRFFLLRHLSNHMEEISLAVLPTTAEYEGELNSNKPVTSLAILHNKDSVKKIRDTSEKDNSLNDGDNGLLLSVVKTLDDNQQKLDAGTRNQLNKEASTSQDQVISDKAKSRESMIAGPGLEMWMRTRDSDKVALLLDSLAGDMEIPTEALIGAARNRDYGADVMALLLDKSTTKLRITHAVVKAAVQNEGCGDRVLRLLLTRCGLDMELPKDIMEIASGNDRLGDKLILILSENFPHIEGTAASNGFEARQPAISTAVSLLDKYRITGTLGASPDAGTKGGKKK